MAEANSPSEENPTNTPEDSNVQRELENNSLIDIFPFDDPFVELLKATGDETSNYVEMLLLPVMTAASGLMGKSCVYTQRLNLNYKEPNILWTCVSANPGSRKSGALSVICEALKKIPVDEDALPISQTSTPSNSHRNVATKRLFVNNETITTAKLHEELVVNDGVYLSLLDEIDWLFDAVDGRNRPDGIDRRMWLSLYGGSSKGRNTARSSSIIDETRLNYTGFIQPALIKKRLQTDGDKDGFWDRHLLCSAERRSVYFREIGDIVPPGKDLTNLFSQVYSRHNNAQNYTYRLTKDADERFRSYYDLNEDNIKAGKFEHFVGMLNKNPGMVLRLSLVLEGIYSALSAKVYSEETAEREVGIRSMELAISLLTFFNAEKFTLAEIDGDPRDGGCANQSSPDVVLDAMTRDAGEFKTSPIDTFVGVLRRISTMALVQARHLVSMRCLPHGSSGENMNTSKRASQLIIRLAQVEYGELVKHKRSFALRKRPLANMSAEVREIVKKCNKNGTEN